MAYSYINSKGDTYYLNTMTVMLRGNRPQVIYYFTRDIRATAVEFMPDSMEVIESGRTGLPLLKKLTN